MTKQDMLDIIKLLSALESWSFSLSKTLPCHLLESIDRNIQLLESEVLK